MKTIYVGVGDFAASKEPNHLIKTLALGSCVAVVVLDVEHKAVGLLHVALPDSSINRKRSLERPGMFADSGIPALLEEMRKLGYNGNGRVVVKLAGGASIMDPNNTFNIGKRNILAVKKCLWRHKLGALAEDVGGSISRSVSVNVRTGKVVISSPGRGEWEI
ncbi:MAG: chemotaxis protein CheD [Calditrichaeota bacterium]|nr:MAG: chemotaxis protein CheD [Calditrichota bacterium]